MKSARRASVMARAGWLGASAVRVPPPALGSGPCPFGSRAARCAMSAQRARLTSTPRSQAVAADQTRKVLDAGHCRHAPDLALNTKRRWSVSSTGPSLDKWRTATYSNVLLAESLADRLTGMGAVGGSLARLLHLSRVSDPRPQT